MMCSTLSTSTANCITERQLRSLWTTTLATLRCTKSSPGARSTISLAGTRLSEQPIHRYFGRCWRDSRAKNSGSFRRMRSDQARLLSRRCWRLGMAGILPARAAGLLRELDPGGRVVARLLASAVRAVDAIADEAVAQP